MTGRTGILSLPRNAMMTFSVDRDAVRIDRSPRREFLHTFFWLGLVPVATVAGAAGPVVALLGIVLLALLLPALSGVLRTQRILLDKASRQVDFIDCLGRRQPALAIGFESIDEVEVREVTDTDCPLFQVLLSSESGTSELTAGGVPDERLAFAPGDAVTAFLVHAGLSQLVLRRRAGKAVALHTRNPRLC